LFNPETIGKKQHTIWSEININRSHQRWPSAQESTASGININRSHQRWSSAQGSTASGRAFAAWAGCPVSKPLLPYTKDVMKWNNTFSVLCIQLNNTWSVFHSLLKKQALTHAQTSKPKKWLCWAYRKRARQIQFKTNENKVLSSRSTLNLCTCSINALFIKYNIKSNYKYILLIFHRIIRHMLYYHCCKYQKRMWKNVSVTSSVLKLYEWPSYTSPTCF